MTKKIIRTSIMMMKNHFRINSKNFFSWNWRISSWIFRLKSTVKNVEQVFFSIISYMIIFEINVRIKSCFFIIWQFRRILSQKNSNSNLKSNFLFCFHRLMSVKMWEQILNFVIINMSRHVWTLLKKIQINQNVWISKLIWL